MCFRSKNFGLHGFITYSIIDRNFNYKKITHLPKFMLLMQNSLNQGLQMHKCSQTLANIKKPKKQREKRPHRERRKGREGGEIKLSENKWYRVV